jgi:hypothetical protein
LPAVKDAADIKLLGSHGAGVVELIERICRSGDSLGVRPQRSATNAILRT